MASQYRTVGVLGGMGPEATVDFMSKVIAATPADKDQDHLHLIVDHNPGVPNRQAAILSGGDDPGPALAAMAARLQAAGADFLVIPCNTAYVFQESILAAVDIPLLSIIDVTIAAVRSRAPGATAVGVLATDGCLTAGVYQDALEAHGISPILPDAGELESLMTLINGIKAGRADGETAPGMRALAEALVVRGAQALIAGCTEIPLVLDETMVPVPLVSSTDVLAEHTVALARGELPLPARES